MSAALRADPIVVETPRIRIRDHFYTIEQLEFAVDAAWALSQAYNQVNDPDKESAIETLERELGVPFEFKRSDDTEGGTCD